MINLKISLEALHWPFLKNKIPMFDKSLAACSSSNPATIACILESKMEGSEFGSKGDWDIFLSRVLDLIAANFSLLNSAVIPSVRLLIPVRPSSKSWR